MPAMLYTIQSAQTNKYVSFSGSHKAGTPVTTEYYLSVNPCLYLRMQAQLIVSSTSIFVLLPADLSPLQKSKAQLRYSLARDWYVFLLISSLETTLPTLEELNGVQNPCVERSRVCLENRQRRCGLPVSYSKHFERQ